MKGSYWNDAEVSVARRWSGDLAVVHVLGRVRSLSNRLRK
jgi:hypothetical protein